MGTISEKPVWPDGIRHFEANAVLTGGPDCPDNLPISDLANRTAYLKEKVQAAQAGLDGHVAAADPHPQYMTDEDGNAKIAAAVAALVASSPAALDTLKELADALGNDANFAATMNTKLAQKAPLDSAALTGKPTTTTPPANDNSKSIVNSEFVARAIGSIPPALGYTPVQQGGGVGQSTNAVKIGWSGASLKATVDNTDQGSFVFQPGLDGALAKYLPLAGGNVTGPMIVSGSTGPVGASGPGRPTIEIASAGGATDHAYMTFHRPGTYAVHFGLDANNDFSVGGYSMGNASYKFWHAGNFNPAAKQDALGYRPAQAVGDWLNSVMVADYRATSYAPKDRNQGVYFDFRNNDAGALADGGVQHGVITFRQWGVGEDFSGGPVHQLGFTANGNVFHRTGKDSDWATYQRLLKAGQNGTLPDNGMPTAADLNTPPLGWSIFTQEKTANRPAAYGMVFTSSLTGAAAPSNGNWLMQRALTTDNQILTRVNIGAGADKWGPWAQAWTNASFDPGSKATGVGFNMQWAGQDGQPSWMLGGNAPGSIYVYNPSNFRVAYAANAGGTTNAENISNGNSYMRMSWSDPGGQTTYVWGSDGPTGARLSVTGNLSVGDSRKWSGFPLRFAENPGVQPYYVIGIEAGSSTFSLYNRTSMAVMSCVSAMYANQLSGQGLGYAGIGGYILNKNKSGTGLAGGWEQRGQVYDFGSGAAEGNESSSVLWQRTS